MPRQSITNEVARGVKENLYSPGKVYYTYFEEYLHDSLPRGFSGIASGGGSVTPNHLGTVFNPGTTTGDTATLSIPRMWNEPKGPDEIIITVMARVPTTQTNDICQVGLLGGGNKGYLDLQNSEINFRGNIYSIPGLPDGDRGILISMNVALENNTKSRVVVRGEGQQCDVSFIDGVQEGKEMIHMESNGNGNQFQAKYARIDIGWWK